jgi:putative chitinase
MFKTILSKFIGANLILASFIPITGNAINANTIEQFSTTNLSSISSNSVSSNLSNSLSTQFEKIKNQSQLSSSLNSSSLEVISISSSSISSLQQAEQSNSSLQSNSEEIIPQQFILPEALKLDSKIEQKITKCIRQKYNEPKKDIEIVYFNKTKGVNLKLDTEELVDYGIAFVKNSKSKDSRKSVNYTFSINEKIINCNKVSESVFEFKNLETKEQIEEAKKEWDRTKKTPTETKGKKNSLLFNIFKPVNVSAAFDNITNEETYLIQKSKDLGVSDKNQSAYILGTAYHETNKFTRNEEQWYDPNLPWLDTQCKYFNYKYNGIIGNNNINDRCTYRGRGYVQLTGKANYQKFKDITGRDIVNNPDLVLTDNDLARFITVYGMKNGSFRGYKLSDYITSTNQNYYDAREIVNAAHDKAVEIEDYTRRLYLTDSRIINYNPTTPPPAPTTYSKIMFRRKNTNQCIDIDSPYDNKTVYTWECQPSNQNQKWEVIPKGNNEYQYRRLNTNQCLEAYNPQTDGRVYTWTCDNSAEQRFNYNWSTQNLFRVNALSNNQCVAKGNPGNLIPIKMYTCTAAPNNDNFKWDVIGVN